MSSEIDNGLGAEVGRTDIQTLIESNRRLLADVRATKPMQEQHTQRAQESLGRARVLLGFIGTRAATDQRCPLDLAGRFDRWLDKNTAP